MLSSSAPIEPGGPEPIPFATPEAVRYSSATPIGQGGMGRVVAVVDARLGREVARKDVPPDAPGARELERRLVREAWITARLDHPGIVPVHDAGADPSGRPFFTMRLIRGRSLAAALEARDIPEPALLRHFLALCQAIAHAHARGVVHRDIKPHNVMLGELGETQVVDWGVARVLGEADDVAIEGLPGGGETVAGARVGTHAWMSPEQARGEVVGPASDVYALGLVLKGIVSDAARSPEAHAILARALAPEVSARYPDAAALAVDVATWIDGRRLAGATYSPLELARRFYRAFRLPLWIATAALVTIAVVLSVTLADTARERDRALEAEAASERVFVEMLQSRAIEATQRGARPEAELLAANVLARRDSPLARGVLARFAMTEPATSHVVGPAPRCLSARVSPRADRLACMEANGLSLWDLSNLRLEWRSVEPVHAVAWASPGELFVRARADTSGELVDVLTRVRRSTGRYELARVLSADHVALVDDGDTLFAWSPEGTRVLDAPRRQPWALSRDGGVALTYDEEHRRLARIHVTDGTHALLAIDFDEHGPMSAALDADGDRAAIGASDGSLRLLDVIEQRELWRVVATDRPLTRLAFSPDEQWVATLDERGVVRLFASSSGQLVAAPRVRVDEIAWRDHVLVLLGDVVRELVPPRTREALGYRATAGISALAVDGERVALADGRGAVSVFDATSGLPLATLPGDGRAVAKDVAFTRDGLAVIWPGRFRAALWPIEDEPRTFVDDLNLRRVVAGVDGQVVVTSYGATLIRFDGGREVARHLLDDGGVTLDLAASGDGRVIVQLSSRGTAVEVDGPRRAELTDAAMVALDGDGDTIALASSRTIMLSTFGASAQIHIDAPTELSALALAPDAAHVAAGTLDGRVLIFDHTGRLVIDGRDHTQRVSDLAFTPDGRELVSASWDGTAARWSLVDSDTPADTLVNAIEQRHGLGLDHAMHAELR